MPILSIANTVTDNYLIYNGIEHIKACEIYLVFLFHNRTQHHLPEFFICKL